MFSIKSLLRLRMPSLHQSNKSKVILPEKPFERPALLLTIDVEDWFQVENFKPYIPFTEWPYKDLRVEKNTYCLLDLFDEVKVKATFFILGWLAERIPSLVREIHSRGHEVASHGYNHILCSQQSLKDLGQDLVKSKKLLEDIVGFPVLGYRAPSFSISDETLKVVEACEYLYDSSFNSFRINRRYGQLTVPPHGEKGIPLPLHREKGIPLKISDHLYELPISNIRYRNCILPWGGGGYFRLIPFSLFKTGVQHIVKRDNAYVFYLHPWEIDSKQPVVKEASRFFRLRHYINLGNTLTKLSMLIQNLPERQYYFTTCFQYLKHIESKGCKLKSECAD